MGNSSSKKFEQINITINHPKLRNAYITIQNEQRVLRTTQGVQQKMYNEWKSYIEKSIEVIYPQLLLIPKKWEYNRVGFCSNSGTLTIDYDDYPYLLIQEMYDKKGRKTFFDQSDIWYLLYALTAAKADISTVSPNLGDIRPQNIFLNSQGFLKIANPLSWPFQHSALQKFRQGEPCFLPPEKVEELKQAKFLHSLGVNAQIFSIGLTLLSVCTLTDLSCLYNTKKYTFNYELMKIKCNQLTMFQCYSEILKASILNLCNSSSEMRVTFEELSNWIDFHKGKIKSKNSFIIHEVPTKWHNQVKLLKQNLNTVRSSRSSSPMFRNSSTRINQLSKQKK